MPSLKRPSWKADGETLIDHKPFKVLIVDDHLLVRNGLKQVLSEEYRDIVFGEARTADEALAQLAKPAWDLVILDIGIPGKDGFYVLQEILLRRPQTRVLMLSIHAEPPYATCALQMGAAGYLCKDAGRSDLVKAVKNALARKMHFDESVRREVGGPAPGALHASLSAQEYKVLLSVAAGRRNGEVAAELKLSAKTVSTYKRRILNKLCIKSTADLVRYVIEHKLC
jgi:DNA-binding NarL/FixJ family response regulator